jgi:hypothetical protein
MDWKDNFIANTLAREFDQFHCSLKKKVTPLKL